MCARQEVTMRTAQSSERVVCLNNSDWPREMRLTVSVNSHGQDGNVSPSSLPIKSLGELAKNAYS